MPRRALDYYETPPSYVAPLLPLIGSLDGLRVYEPCVGRGHISRYLGAAAYVLTNDIDHAMPAAMHFDARLPEAWPTATTLDWTITNPPFSDELPILLQALAHSHNVAFLARLSFLEPTIARGTFFLAHPPTDVIVLPRYSFRNNDAGKRATDNVTCCWVIYRQGRPPCLSFSLAKEPRNARTSQRDEEEDGDGDPPAARDVVAAGAAGPEASADQARRPRTHHRR